jgi:alkylhydroperoxidase/carboxymuconolactone decarboxylase family protein YurZ
MLTTLEKVNLVLSLAEIEREARALLIDVADGPELDPLAIALIDLGVRVSVTSLRPEAIRESIARAKTAGATLDQIQEIIALVSALGVHSLMASATAVLGAAGNQPPLDEKRAALWQRTVGEDRYWVGFDAELPGFLDALLRLSPATFQAFFDYCAVPWSTRNVRALTKELVAMACDATPAHRFGPGFRLHLKNALKLGAGRQAVLASLRIAAAAPEHDGVA